MRIHELSIDEYPLVMQPLIKAKDYIKDPELGKMLAEAIQILQRASKRQGVPSEGSAYPASASAMLKKVERLFSMFGVDKRIRIGG